MFCTDAIKTSHKCIRYLSIVFISLGNSANMIAIGKSFVKKHMIGFALLLLKILEKGGILNVSASHSYYKKVEGDVV